MAGGQTQETSRFSVPAFPNAFAQNTEQSRHNVLHGVAVLQQKRADVARIHNPCRESINIP